MRVDAGDQQRGLGEGAREPVPRSVNCPAVSKTASRFARAVCTSLVSRAWATGGAEAHTVSVWICAVLILRAVWGCTDMSCSRSDSPCLGLGACGCALRAHCSCGLGVWGHALRVYSLY
eukprot:1067757-Rhodomonas_salina.1